MKISGNFTGPDVDASGVELDGYERLTDDKNTGKPYDGKAYLGNDISIQMKVTVSVPGKAGLFLITHRDPFVSKSNLQTEMVADFRNIKTMGKLDSMGV